MKNLRRTNIVGTIGPASESEEMLTKLMNAGLNVTRINFSHGGYEENATKIETIKKVRKALNRPVALVLDTKGPEIRTGKFLSLVLRHKPETIGLKLDKNGWADVDELLAEIDARAEEIKAEGKVAVEAAPKREKKDDRGKICGIASFCSGTSRDCQRVKVAH